MTTFAVRFAARTAKHKLPQPDCSEGAERQHKHLSLGWRLSKGTGFRVREAQLLLEDQELLAAEHALPGISNRGRDHQKSR